MNIDIEAIKERMYRRQVMTPQCALSALVEANRDVESLIEALETTSIKAELSNMGHDMTKRELERCRKELEFDQAHDNIAYQWLEARYMQLYRRARAWKQVAKRIFEDRRIAFDQLDGYIEMVQWLDAEAYDRARAWKRLAKRLWKTQRVGNDPYFRMPPRKSIRYQLVVKEESQDVDV